ncbi:MAG TPA: hypothetical protein VMO80_16055 [Terriglobales bacterium]|jgi:hypothetical protein|nr:hypothetical protein [Terriglobales bacterium]
MGTKPTSRAILVGRLMVIAPAMAAIPLVVFLGLRTFGPFLILYYVVTGIALGWQWYSIAVPRWREWLAKKEVHDSEVAHLVHRAGLVSPGGVGAVGLFALHTTTVALCSIFLAPRVGRWLAWLLTGSATMPGAGDYYLQHMELLAILPTLVIGYVVSRHFPRLAIWAWTLPTIILVYNLLTFTNPSRSVMFSDPWSRFTYFFVIQRSMPVLAPGFGGVDVIRVVQQMFVAAPFYSGLAYTLGALAARHNLLQTFSAGPRSMAPDSWPPQAEGIVEDAVVEESEKPVP